MTTELLRNVLGDAQQQGFLGPGSVDRAVDHARGFAEGVPTPPARFLDLGSGGGLPGLVLVQHWPKATAALLDANQRRCAFLHEAVETLGLADRVTVVEARAEEAGRDPVGRGSYDLVVARSFARPAVTAECAAPFLRVDGRLVVSEPPSAGEDVEADAEAPDRWLDDGLAEVGMRRDRRWVTGLPAGYQSFVQVTLCPDRYPRRVGIPAKRPLF